MTADEYDTGEAPSPTTPSRSGDRVAGGTERPLRATPAGRRAGADRLGLAPATDGASVGAVRIAAETTVAPPEATRYV